MPQMKKTKEKGKCFWCNTPTDFASLIHGMVECKKCYEKKHGKIKKENRK